MFLFAFFKTRLKLVFQIVYFGFSLSYSFQKNTVTIWKFWLSLVADQQFKQQLHKLKKIVWFAFFKTRLIFGFQIWFLLSYILKYGPNLKKNWLRLAQGQNLNNNYNILIFFVKARCTLRY